MAMIKRATGKIEKFTDAEGDEVVASDEGVVWADEKKQEPIKDELVIPLTTDVDLDINSTDDDDDIVAKDC
ncbi:MAG: hypothetical protein RL621_1377 [Bacteroidota bacterium]|jgi:hypothetical protein